MQLRVTHSAVGTARSCAVKVAHTLRPSVAAKVSKGTQAAEAASQAVKDVEVEADQHGLPGQTELMKVKPLIIKPDYKGSGKLSGKVALITGGDSGIGRSIAVHFAKEGVKGVVIVHLAEEQQDAEETVRLVEAEGCKCHAVVADVTEPKAGELAVNAAIKQFGQLDVLINNAGEQTKKESILDITPEQLQRTFATNIFSMFYLTKAALPHLKPGSSIINAASLLAYQAKPVLVDYASSKGAVVSFTRSLSEQLVGKGIRVNAVAPGPTWTPLNPATMGEDLANTFGEEVPMKRGGQPCEIATAYVFLASEVDSSFITGQVLHPNGGAVLNV